jgi:hypothetical protein
MRAADAIIPLALAVLLSGCASSGDHRDGAIDLAAGGFKEFKVALAKGDTIDYQWSTAGGEAVHFDFHTHQDGGVQHIREETAASGNGTFKAEKAGSYYLFWQNDGNDTAEMEYKVTTSGKVTAEYQ